MKYLKHIWIPIALILVYLLFFKSPDQKKGKTAPEFSAELIDGTPFSLSDLRGQYVLIDFWGSWCPPCRRDNPKLVQLHKEFNGKKFQDAQGFELVTIALERNDRYWKKASENDGFVWKHQIVTQAKAVLLSPLAQKYNVSEVPSKFLVNPQGEIIGVNQSYEELSSFLRSKM